MNSADVSTPTPLGGISYVTPPAGYILSGRDGRVAISWDGKPPIPLLDEDLASMQQGTPDYDMVGRGIYQALRLDPECAHAAEYAAVLKEAYPHIVSELGGQIIMLDAKEVDSPYLDRKITFLKILSLLDPSNAGVQAEIGRTFADRGSRLAALQQAVESWYGAERHLKKALELGSPDSHVAYEYGEALYVVGALRPGGRGLGRGAARVGGGERARLDARIAAILAGKLPWSRPWIILQPLRWRWRSATPGATMRPPPLLKMSWRTPSLPSSSPWVRSITCWGPVTRRWAW